MSRAVKNPETVFVNVSPALHTVPIIVAQGFNQIAAGCFVGVPALAPTRRGVSVTVARNGWVPPAGIDAAEARLLVDHTRFGCLALWLDTPDGGHAFVFRRRVLRLGRVPCAMLIHCPSLELLERFAGPLGRALAREGLPLLLAGADRPLRGMPGRHFPAKWPIYAKGAVNSRSADLSYTEAAVFGMRPACPNRHRTCRCWTERDRRLRPGERGDPTRAMFTVPGAAIPVLIVTFGNARDAMRCLRALGRMRRDPSFAVFICENGGAAAFDEQIALLTGPDGVCDREAEPDGTPMLAAPRLVRIARLRLRDTAAGGLVRVQIGQAAENMGYAGGVNAFLGPMLEDPGWPGAWILNPDTEPDADALHELKTYSTQHARSMVGSRLITDRDQNVVQLRGLAWRRWRGATAAVDRLGPAIPAQTDRVA